MYNIISLYIIINLEWSQFICDYHDIKTLIIVKVIKIKKGDYE